MSTSGRLLLLFSIAWATFWGAPGCFADTAGAPVRLVAPDAGATLTAGTTAELEWAPLAAFTGLPEVEEWEAFLSLDGGATYPLRITPHLDQDLRRVLWQVPDLPTPHASILLRFGDEHRETAVELPVRFSIAAPPVPSSWWSALALARRVAAPGEPALPGRAGVVSWIEGSRRGGSQVQVVAAEPLAGLQPGFDPVRAHREVSETVSEPLPTGSPLARAPAKGPGAEPPVRRGASRAAARIPEPPFDILLLIQRQNE